jgi:hypothetical protein
MKAYIREAPVTDASGPGGVTGGGGTARGVQFDPTWSWLALAGGQTETVHAVGTRRPVPATL